MKKVLEEIRHRKKEEWLALAAVLVFFLFFALITHWTPACGDDWVYATGGRWNNPFVQAMRMYQTWSGRYLSELWGFLVAPHKPLWNLLNPLLFTGILILLTVLSKRRNHLLMRITLAILLVLMVSNHLRMQTYTWIMGTTYVLPLFLFLIQIYLLREMILEKHDRSWTVPVLCVLNFCIPLYMENAAALMVGGDLLVLIYLAFFQQRRLKRMGLITVFAVIGTLIILLSPGARARMSNDNAAFASLSLLEKIAGNWPLFLEHTFTEHSLITTALFAAGAWTIYHLRPAGILRSVFALAVCAGVILRNGWFYFLLYLVMIVLIFAYEEDQRLKYYLIYLLLCALGANAVMVVSPIFDSRSGLYTVYLMILAALTMADEAEIKPLSSWILAGVSAAFAAVSMVSYYQVYHMVHEINIRRYQQIEYYRLRPDAGDAWLIAYPDESIHSPNVQEGDETHMYYFKEYYSLSQDLHLVFYYLKEYTTENIFGG